MMSHDHPQEPGQPGRAGQFPALRGLSAVPERPTTAGHTAITGTACPACPGPRKRSGTPKTRVLLLSVPVVPVVPVYGEETAMSLQDAVSELIPEPNEPKSPAAELEIQLQAIAERHGFAPSELAEACGEDWSWLRLRPDYLEPVAAALAASYAIDRGDTPAGWTDTLACPACGPVPIWPGGGDITDAVGCPWCRRRGQGLPVPPAT